MNAKLSIVVPYYNEREYLAETLHSLRRWKKGWFFYEFLAKRFARRGLVQAKLRERNF